MNAPVSIADINFLLNELEKIMYYRFFNYNLIDISLSVRLYL